MDSGSGGFELMAGLSAQEVRARQVELMTGQVAEQVVVERLSGWLRSASASYSETLAGLVEAIRSGDRQAELVLWRRLECTVPYGFPSEVP